MARPLGSKDSTKRKPRAPMPPESVERRREGMRRAWAKKSPEEKALIGARISASLTGQKQSESHRKANSDGHKGLKKSDASKRKQSEALKRAYTEGRKQPVRSSHRKGAKFTDEQRARLSASLKGRTVWNKGIKTGPKDPAVIAKTAKTLSGRKRVITPAMIDGAKRAGAKKMGVKQSDECRANRAAGLRLAYAEGRRVVSPRSGYGTRWFYDSPYQGRVCLRSSSELQRARELDAEGVVWFYEALRYVVQMEDRSTTYTPDFWVIPSTRRSEVQVVSDVRTFLAQNEHEVEDVKGWWGPKHKTYPKILAFQAQHPEVNFSVVVREGISPQERAA